MESSHFAAVRRVKLWSLNATLFFKEPQQLPKFPSLVESMSHQTSNCNIFVLNTVVFAKEALFCCSGHVLSKTKSVTPPPPLLLTFSLLPKLDHYLSAWQVLKNLYVETFWARTVLTDTVNLIGSKKKITRVSKKKEIIPKELPCTKHGDACRIFMYYKSFCYLTTSSHSKVRRGDF